MLVQTPTRYREHLQQVGGLNQYGEPIFQLLWGSQVVKRAQGQEMFLMPNEGLAKSLQCWVLSQWKSREQLGDPELYDFSTEFGAYLPLQVFRDDGRATMLDTDSLNLEVLSLFVWVILNHENDSLRKRQDFLKDETAKVEAAKKQSLIDRIEDGAPAFTDAVSFTGQLNVNSVVKQKMEYLEKNLTRITERAARFPRGGIMQQPVA